MEGYQWGGRGERLGKKVQGVRSVNGRHKIDRGNGEAKELICTTHGHELRWGNAGGRKGIGLKNKGVEKMGQL